MRRRKFIFITLLVLAVIAGAVWLLTPGEPRYQGKRLSEWLRSLDKPPVQFHSDYTVETNEFTVQAILHMGTNALPFLVRELRARDSAVKLRLLELLGKQSIFRVDFTPAHVRNRRAIVACSVLGPGARMAIPELTELLDEHRISAWWRTFPLAAIGSDALPSLISALTNREPEVRRCAATQMRNGPFDAEPAVPALVNCLSSTQHYILRCEASMALGRIRKRPELVLPVLTQNLSDTDETVRSFTRMALRQFYEDPPAVVDAAGHIEAVIRHRQ